MRVLLTNDDGVHAEGLAALAGELSVDHEVFVFAPDQERSGVSHAVSLRAAGRVRRHGDRVYSCSGTPVDCIILAGLGAISFHPDIVVSGINRGPNLGTDILFSGTCGAARQASMHGIPSVAVSCASFHEPLVYTAGADFLRRNLDELAKAWIPGTFINVNVPSVAQREVPARWAYPCSRVYNDRLVSFEAPDGYTYCFLAESRIETEPSSHSDHEVVGAGEIAVSRISCQPATAGMEGMTGRLFGREG